MRSRLVSSSFFARQRRTLPDSILNDSTRIRLADIEKLFHRSLFSIILLKEPCLESQTSFRFQLLTRSLPLISPFGLPVAVFPARARWHGYSFSLCFSASIHAIPKPAFSSSFTISNPIRSAALFKSSSDWPSAR
jgi:hypothetical protein